MTTVDVDGGWQWMRSALEELTRDPDTPWEVRRQSFLNKLGLQEPSQDPMIEQLLQHLDESSEADRSSDMIDSLAYDLFQQHRSGQDAGQGQEAAAGQGQEAAAYYDEQAWQAYLAQNGPQWDGTEETWEQFRQWFLYHADQQGLSAPATALLDYLSAQPAAERITTFAQYGITITPAQQPADDAAAYYDEQAWQAYLAQNGPQWDGTEETWEQFRQWFLYHADQQGLSAPATALLDYLSAQPAAERITTFAQYGITITPAQQPAAPETAAPETAAPETVQPTGAEVSGEQIGSIMKDLLEENPEFAEIPEEQRMKIVSEVLDELQTS